MLPAGTRAASHDELARQILHWDGTHDHLLRLARLDAVLGATAARIYATLPADERPDAAELRALQAHLRARSGASLRSERLARDAVEHLASTMDAAPMPGVLSFFESALGRRMAFARADAESPAGKRRMGAYLTRLSQRAPDLERRDRLLRLMQISGADQLWFTMSYGLVERVLATLAPTLPDWFQRVMGGEIAAGTSLRDEFRTRIRKTWVLEHTYAYRELSLAELDDAIAFWDSAEGRRYAIARQRAVDVALEGWLATLVSAENASVSSGATQAARLPRARPGDSCHRATPSRAHPR